MNQTDLLIPAWVDHELHNWARWSLSAEYPWSPEWPGPVRHPRCGSAEGKYRTPDWGDAPRSFPPNEAHAQIVEDAVAQRMHPLERRIVDAEYLHPRDSGRASYGRTGAARRLQISLETYEMRLRSACLKVERAFDR